MTYRAELSDRVPSGWRRRCGPGRRRWGRVPRTGDRLLAFLDAIIEVVSRNKNLMAELAYPVAAQQHARERAAGDRDKHPVYRFWHGHISALLAVQRPDIDAGMTAHLMLGSLHSESVLDQLTTDGPARVAASMRALACAVLDAP